ncbi:MAG: sigma-70 family RNA polymerase sigma factor [Alphaproteobacteria bacterium]
MDQQIENKKSPKDANLLVPEIPYMRRYARALTRNAADADDLVQNALMRAVANFDRFEDGTNLRAWLLTIVHNVFIDGTRKAKRERDANQLAEERMSGLYTSPSQMAALQIGELEDALARLPEEQRITLILVALEDMSYEEAAKVTGVPVGTVRSRLSRARHAVMGMIEGLTMDDISPEMGATRRKKAQPTPMISRRPKPAVGTNGTYQRMI